METRRRLAVCAREVFRLAYRFEEERLHSEYCLETLDFTAGTKGVSFSDAAYHVLAIRTDGLFVTADRKYLARAGRKGHIAPLANWTPPARE